MACARSSPVYEQPGRFCLHYHVGYRCLNQLKVYDVVSELPPLRHIPRTAIKRSLSNGKRHGGVAQALYAERSKQAAESASRLYDVRRRNPDILQNNVSRSDPVETHQLLLRAEGYTRSASINDDCADPPSPRSLGHPAVHQVPASVTCT